MVDIELTGKEQIAEGTMAFRFKSKEPFTFIPGQNGDFSVPGKGPDWSRTFSFASDPEEDELMIATRMRDGSEFKQWLAGQPDGTVLSLVGPMGRFVLPESTENQVVFIVGGIGITPVRSMVSWSTRIGSGHRMTLLYANRSRDSTAFFDDLEQWAGQNEHFTFVPVLDEAPHSWSYETGRIDEDMIKKYVDDVAGARFYVVGPPGMVAAMGDLLEGMGATVIREDFAGY